MTYLGYMALANNEGETLELVNAARVKAYTDNLAPSLGLRGCDDCEGLDAALGETYTDPVADNAPWYDPTDPATAGFYGVYPLGFEGIDDSTRTIESEELTGDGSVVVGSRFAGQDIRVTGMAFARDEAALYAGVSWLNSALDGTEDGRCFGDRLNVFSSCPPVQVLPPNFATPWLLSNPASAAELGEWTTTSGPITSTPDGIQFLWGSGDPQKIACRTISGLIPGEQYQLRLRLENYGDYYVSMGRGCVERSTNLLYDPRLTSTTMTLNGATVVDSRPSTGAPDGGSYFSRQVVAANTSSPMAMALTPSISGALPVVEGQSYTTSWSARKSIPGGPSSRVDWNWWDSVGNPLTSSIGSANSPGQTWGQFSQTAVAPATAVWGQPRLVWSGTAFITQVLDLAQVIVNVGTSGVPYFDGNYPNARWEGDQNNSRSFLVENVDALTYAGWAGNPPEEPTVLDFIARAETMNLSIQPTDSSPAVPTLDLRVEQGTVRRVARPGVLAFGSGYDVVPPSDGWTHRAPAGNSVVWVTGASVEYNTVRTDMRSPSGSTSTYLTTHGVVRTVFGLTPGARYRFSVEFDEAWAPNGAAPTQTLNPFVNIPNSSSPIATYSNNPTAFRHNWVIEFTATATSTEIGLHPNNPLALGSQALVTWSINQFLVEEILVTDTVPPQPGRNQARTMYEVKASQGVIVTNVRKAPCGVRAEITYGLRAGQPFKYRQPILAGGLPAGTSQTVTDVPCSEDGLPQIINFAYNPSVEANLTDWLGGGTNVNPEQRVISSNPIVGQYVFQATAPNNPSARLDNIAVYYNTSSVTSGPTILPGDEITVSIYFRSITSSGVTALGVWDYIFYVGMSDFPPIARSGTVNVTTNLQWYRIEETFVLPSNVDLEVIEMNIMTPSTLTQGGGAQADGLMIQRGPVATAPFDETNPEAEWSGIPNSSALLLNQTIPDISADPDCPVPPAPPMPPQIEDACVDSPTTYSRTVVSIPDDTVPRNLTAYPVITLTAGSAAVRQARIRFWENPDNLLIDDLDPCAYDGEIIVSYLAAGATMVIDGVLQEATVTAPGFAAQNANHVLYGPDGGPVDWPELSGGVPYLVTLELDSTSPYSDTLMTIDLVVRD